MKKLSEKSIIVILEKLCSTMEMNLKAHISIVNQLKLIDDRLTRIEDVMFEIVKK